MKNIKILLIIWLGCLLTNSIYMNNQIKEIKQNQIELMKQDSINYQQQIIRVNNIK